jgi:hypothetical protein
MSAGLPGLGLGGLFFILSALLAPPIEAMRMVRGRSSRERRRQVARQFVLALAMLVVIDLTLRAVLLAGAAAGATATPDLGVVALPLAPIGITTSLLALVVVGAKLAELTLGPRHRRAERASRARSRIGALTTESR